mgnify:CR=1 FL=1
MKMKEEDTAIMALDIFQGQNEAWSATRVSAQKDDTGQSMDGQTSGGATRMGSDTNDQVRRLQGQTGVTGEREG